MTVQQTPASSNAAVLSGCTITYCTRFYGQKETMSLPPMRPYRTKLCVTDCSETCASQKSQAERKRPMP
jgi:hypothetical protein